MRCKTAWVSSTDDSSLRRNLSAAWAKVRWCNSILNHFRNAEEAFLVVRGNFQDGVDDRALPGMILPHGVGNRGGMGRGFDGLSVQLVELFHVAQDVVELLRVLA